MMVVLLLRPARRCHRSRMVDENPVNGLRMPRPGGSPFLRRLAKETQSGGTNASSRVEQTEGCGLKCCLTQTELEILAVVCVLRSESPVSSLRAAQHGYSCKTKLDEKICSSQRTP